MEEKALIEIMDMKKIYNPGENEVRALDGVNLKIYPNEFVAIIGHSGSGKSTLMNMLGCLDVPTSGTYMLHNIDVSDMVDDELAEAKSEKSIATAAIATGFSYLIGIFFGIYPAKKAAKLSPIEALRHE